MWNVASKFRRLAWTLHGLYFGRYMDFNLSFGVYGCTELMGFINSLPCNKLSPFQYALYYVVMLLLPTGTSTCGLRISGLVYYSTIRSLDCLYWKYMS